jgi:hypothetical protein
MHSDSIEFGPEEFTEYREDELEFDTAAELADLKSTVQMELFEDDQYDKETRLAMETDLDKLGDVFDLNPEDFKDADAGEYPSINPIEYGEVL